MDKDDVRFLILEMILSHRNDVSTTDAAHVAKKLYDEMVSPSPHSPSLPSSSRRKE